VLRLRLCSGPIATHSGGHWGSLHRGCFRQRCPNIDQVRLLLLGRHSESNPRSPIARFRACSAPPAMHCLVSGACEVGRQHHAQQRVVPTRPHCVYTANAAEPSPGTNRTAEEARPAFRSGLAGSMKLLVGADFHLVRCLPALGIDAVQRLAHLRQRRAQRAADRNRRIAAGAAP